MHIDTLTSSTQGVHIGVIPEWVRKIWFFRQIKGIAFRKSFLLNRELYDDVMSTAPSVENLGIVVHEIEHIKRAKQIGFWKYQILYRLSREFRYQEELACHRPQFVYYHEHNYQFDLENRAKIMSGPLYLWMVKNQRALADLQALWDETRNSSSGRTN